MEFDLTEKLKGIQSILITHGKKTTRQNFVSHESITNYDLEIENRLILTLSVKSKNTEFLIHDQNERELRVLILDSSLKQMVSCHLNNGERYTIRRDYDYYDFIHELEGFIKRYHQLIEEKLLKNAEKR